MFEHNYSLNQPPSLKDKFFNNIFVIFIEFYLLLMGGTIIFSIAGVFIAAIVINSLNLSLNEGLQFGPETLELIQYYSTFATWAACLGYMSLRKNRNLFHFVGSKSPGNKIRFIFFGLLTGFGLNAVCILAAFLNKDIEFTFNPSAPVTLVILFIGVFIQSSSEELLCRGLVYQRLIKSYKKPVIAVVGNSLFFTALHLANPGLNAFSIISIFLSGILFSILTHYYNSIWAAMWAHTGWNYTQAVLFGLPNSGLPASISIFSLNGSASDSIFYNNAFGIEGTLFACIILLVACIGLYMFKRNSREEGYDVWNLQNKETELLKSV